MARKKNEKAWQNLTQKLNDFKIEAGWFENSVYNDGTSIAEIARVQNYGAHIHQVVTEKQRNFLHYIGIHLKNATKDLNITIPPRPFMDNAKRRIQSEEGRKIILQEVLRVFEGRQTMEEASERMGAWVQGIIQEEIKAISTPALAQSTIEARQRAYTSESKNKSTKPLNSTGMMFSSVQHKVTKLN